ncbi:MAG: hypothetical protein ACYDCI_05660 [Candidatus Limnocylindrales bacterium]
MRIRQLKPSWFTDKALQIGVRSDTREFYIGLWMLADDDGWLEWDVDAIGVGLYGFLSLGRRTVLIERHAAALQALTPESPHLVLYPCGHARVPKMPQHQRVSDARRVVSDHQRHDAGRCPVPAPSRGEPRSSAERPGGNGTVRERNGTGTGSARERETEEATGGLKGRLGAFEDVVRLGAPHEVPA